LKILTLSCRPCARTVALTTAPATSGVPTFSWSPSPTDRTWSRVISCPMSAGICSTLSFSPAATRYCLPPDFTTAYMGVSLEKRSSVLTEPKILACPCGKVKNPLRAGWLRGVRRQRDARGDGPGGPAHPLRHRLHVGRVQAVAGQRAADRHPLAQRRLP